MVKVIGRKERGEKTGQGGEIRKREERQKGKTNIKYRLNKLFKRYLYYFTIHFL